MWASSDPHLSLSLGVRPAISSAGVYSCSHAWSGADVQSQFWWSDHLALREASLAEETGICSCTAVVKSSTVEEHKRGSPTSGVLARGLEKVSGRRWELGLNDEMELES